MQKCLDTLQVIRRGTGSEIPWLSVNQEERLLSAVSCSLLWSPRWVGQLPGTANGTQPLLFPPY